MSKLLTFAPLMMGAPEGANGQSSSMMTFISFGLVILIFYFLIIRPQNKKQKEAQNMMSSLKKGDKVVTIGGIRGTIFSLKEDSVVLKVDDNTKMEFSKSAIASVVNPQPKGDAAAAPAKKSLFGKKKKSNEEASASKEETKEDDASESRD